MALAPPGATPPPVPPLVPLPARVVPAPGADGRDAVAAALLAAADALVRVDADEVAEALEDLADDVEVVVTALGPAWFAADSVDRPLLVLRELVHPAVGPDIDHVTQPTGSGVIGTT